MDLTETENKKRWQEYTEKKKKKKKTKQNKPLAQHDNAIFSYNRSIFYYGQ